MKEARFVLSPSAEHHAQNADPEASQPVQKGTATGKFDACGRALLTSPNQFMPRLTRP